MDSSEFKRILMCLRYGIGDVVMELPILEVMRRHWPKAFISGLGACPAIELLENDGRVDALIAVQDWGLNHWGDTGTPEIRRRIGDWIEKNRFDLILDPSHAVWAVREVLWQQSCKIYDSGNPEIQLRKGAGGGYGIKAAVYAGWGMKVPRFLLPRIEINAAEDRFAEEFLRFYDLKNHALIGIAPIASSNLKQWPLERFAALADAMTDSMPVRFLLFCGPQEKVGDVLLERMKNPKRVVSVGAFHLRRIAALIRRCKLFLCNDTGLMHMAAAVHTPVAALFGPTSSRIYLPTAGAVAIQSKVNCEIRKTNVFGPSDCIAQNRCLVSSRSCIEEIHLDRVIREIGSYVRRI